MSEVKALGGPIAACAEYAPREDGCNFKHGECLSGMAHVVGKCLNMDWGAPTQNERAQIQRNADLMERLASVLRKAVEWVEAGNNGSARNADDLLSKGLKRTSRAK